MASLTSITLPFLRPLRLPQPSTIRHYLRFSTSTPQCAQQHQQRQPNLPPQTTQRKQLQPPKHEDRNLLASYTASPTYPPHTLPSLPRPKQSKAYASRRRSVSQPPAPRAYPTRQPTHHSPAPRTLIPKPIIPLSAEHCAPNLAYFVSRTRSNELPVYQASKRGGNLKLTRVRKIDGDAGVLRDELRKVLGLAGERREDCVVNPVTGQVVVRGHVKGVVERFLRERMF